MSDPRDGLLELLGRYVPADAAERSVRDRILQFVRRNPRCFERSLAEGHLTGSAWIVDRTRAHALLHHHRKLTRWLQPGGHADGDSDILLVALREAREETGLDEFRVVSPEVFDLDVHEIPARASESAHLHYDVRFLLEADRGTLPSASDESHEVAWLPLAAIEAWTAEDSILRMVRKVKAASGRL